MTSVRKFALALCLGLGTLGLAGCEEPEGPAERTGEAIDNSVERAGEAIQNSGERIQEEADDADDDD